MAIDRIDREELNAALDIWRGYKHDLMTQRNMQQQGISVPNTRMSEFTKLMDDASRRMANAVGCTDPDELESIGELFMNASIQIKNGAWS